MTNWLDEGKRLEAAFLAENELDDKCQFPDAYKRAAFELWLVQHSRCLLAAAELAETLRPQKTPDWDAVNAALRAYRAEKEGE